MGYWFGTLIYGLVWFVMTGGILATGQKGQNGCDLAVSLSRNFACGYTDVQAEQTSWWQETLLQASNVPGTNLSSRLSIDEECDVQVKTPDVRHSRLLLLVHVRFLFCCRSPFCAVLHSQLHSRPRLYGPASIICVAMARSRKAPVQEMFAALICRP